METPGGWHLIGRTPIRPFDESRSEPVLFRPGDRVRFRAIAREEYDAMSGT
jgi:allophanate hydrolase subunit 1